MSRGTKTFDEVLDEEKARDPKFAAEWHRLAPAREFAVALIRYRADEKLSQRELAERLGVSQPRVNKLESGDHNPSVETIINAAKKLGIEFAIDIAPAGRKPTLVTARARKGKSVEFDDVTVVAAWAS
jgi:transcriptional regulator with XRE-family HTH domain